MDSFILRIISHIVLIVTLSGMVIIKSVHGQMLNLNEHGYFEQPGVNVLLFSNPPGGMFSDAKTSGLEIIHHGERTVTNGDVRLHNTPEQWDDLAEFLDREIVTGNNSIEARLRYSDYDFNYTVKATANEGGVILSVHLDSPLPAALEGRAGFNLEFLPAAYFGKAYLMDGNSGIFPRHPTGLMEMRDNGKTEPRPIAAGQKLVLAPEDPERRITITSATTSSSSSSSSTSTTASTTISATSADESGRLMLFDGRTKAQNGWYVVRTLIPAGRTGNVIEWFIEANAIPEWTREPLITYSQVGYHPDQQKRAVIELDQNDSPLSGARLLKVSENGEITESHAADVENWGKYLRYNYLIFDFSEIIEPGLYILEYGDVQTSPFRIDPDVYADSWHLTLDVFFPVQMDHMLVREAYRTWHGASHLDDALQAPVNYEHFDLYAMGAESDTDFETFEHIPGLNIGGWYDAGDYDIRTQSQYSTVQHLVHAREQFGIDRDNTTVSQEKRYVEIHLPDEKPDILHQIEHGTLGLVAQHRAVGHAIHGIVESHLYQYPHLGDGITKTDNLIYNPEMDPFADERHPGEMFNPDTDHPRPDRIVIESDGIYSGQFDDRWAFTTRSSALNYGSAASLAAASRVLRGFNDELAEESLETAIRVWDEEQNQEPFLFRHGNTTGGLLVDEELKATVELLITTGDRKYTDRIKELLPEVEGRFISNAMMLVLALPHMDDEYAGKIRELTRNWRDQLGSIEEENPFGVPITRGGWAGGGTVIGFAVTNYYLHKAFPELIDREYVFRGLNFIFGTHPGSNISFVSGVGTESQLVAYGMNRADFSFIPGGIVPGVLILPPDFPENKENWPFFWGQNEYVIPLGASYLFLANAVHHMLTQD